MDAESGRRINARGGLTISFADALIAATALEHGLVGVTTNARHFNIPGLAVQAL